MENFIPLDEVFDDKTVADDYEQALDFDKIAVGENLLFFNRFARVEYLPICKIERVYRLVGGINPNQCCNVSFDVFILAVKYARGTVEGRIMYEFQYKEIEDVLRKRNPNIIFAAE